MKKYVIYKRVSTERQGKSGLGVDAQQRDVELFLVTYADEPFEVIAEFTDVISGSSNERPRLMEAIDLAKKHDAELLVAKLDRLSRKVSVIASLMEDPKLRFRVATMPHADNLQLHIYAALAEQEREFISIRTKAALAEAKARGRKLGGMRDATGRRNAVLASNAQARAKRVSGLIQPMRDKGLTFRAIAEALNEAGTPTARGGQWQASQVMRVCRRLDALD